MTLSSSFEIYLSENRKVGKKTLRNYRADLRHFLLWCQSELLKEGLLLNNLEDLIPHLGYPLFSRYRSWHITTGADLSTANRRFSTLRSFGNYLYIRGLVPTNPSEHVDNIRKEVVANKNQEIIESFERHLKKSPISVVTLKNYISDIRQFLNWIESQGSQARTTL